MLRRLVRFKYFIPTILLLAFLVRLFWIILVNSQPTSDFAWYFERAVGIANGKGYTVNGVPTAYWPVGYPAFLGLLFAIFGSSLFVAKLANVMLYIGVLIFSFRIAKEVFNSEFVGRVTLMLLAFYPNHIVYSSLLASEIIFLFLLLFGIAILVKRGDNDHIRKRVFVSGLIFGLACLVRPPALFIPALVIPCCSPEKQNFWKKGRLCLVAYLAVALVLLPWTVRNHRAFQQLVFVSNNGGVNLLIGNNPNATGRFNTDWDEATVASLESAQGEYEINRVSGEIALRYMLGHPLKMIKLWPKKLYYLYYSDVEGISWNVAGMNSADIRANKRIIFMFKIISQGYYMFLMAAFVLSIPILFLRRIWKKSDNVWLSPQVGLYVILYFTSISLLFFGNTRFHFPVMPWIAMYVAGLLETLMERPNIVDESVLSRAL